MRFLRTAACWLWAELLVKDLPYWMGILITLVSKKLLKILSLLTSVSKLEVLTSTCDGEERHVAGQNSKER